MSKPLSHYCQKFSRLRVDRSRGIAPHKPILLLSVIELIEQGLLRQNQIALSAELIAAFLKLWNQLGSASHSPDIALPFFHLKGDGFWHFKANPGFSSLLSSKTKIRAISALREAVQYAYLDNELFELLQLPASRDTLLKVLLDAWFSSKTQQVEEILQINAFQEFQNQLRETGGAVYQAVDLEDEARTIVRDAAFRRTVVSVYNFRCAFCGLQIISELNQNIVDGAHIKPFSQFYDDRIDNGISLCKNHHWAFDRGWFSLEDDYTLLISNSLREDSPHATPMREFHGRTIWLPSQEQYRPRLEAICWHRKNTFGDLSD